MKSGFVVLIGRSNVGKSTLLNTLVGTKIAATSGKPQMTRHIIHGVFEIGTGQAIIVDTPGVLKEGKNPLSGRLFNKIKEALDGIDVILYVVDPSREIGPEERATFGMIRHLDIPKILVINKSDLPKRQREFEREYLQLGEDCDAVIALSALHARHIQPLKEKIMELLPVGEPVYSGGQLTNVDEFFWVSEIIREKIFNVFDKEVPYSITVEVDSIEEANFGMNQTPGLRIEARILTNQDRYKKIIIGKGGYKLKEIGQLARRELEQATNKKVFLHLQVDVDPHWIQRI